MADISGTFNLPSGTLTSGTYNLDDLDEATRAKLEQAVAAQGKGDIGDDSLIQLQTVKNQDGSITVSYTITLDPPNDVDEQARQGASRAIGNLANNSDSMTDVYEIMQEFFLIAQKQRELSDKSGKSLLKQQVDALNKAADDIKAGAGWALAGAVAMGALQIVGGLAQLGAASKALGAVNEARGLTNQANALTEEEPQLQLNENESQLSLSEDEDEPELDRPGRKNAIDMNDEDGGSVSESSNDESPQNKALEEEEALQEQDADNKEKNAEDTIARYKKAGKLKQDAELLLKEADLMGQKGQAFSQVFGGAGQAMKGGGDFADQQYQADAKTADAAATQASGMRDSMEKFKDNAQQSMNAALQGLGQISQQELQTVRQIWS